MYQFYSIRAFRSCIGLVTLFSVLVNEMIKFDVVNPRKNTMLLTWSSMQRLGEIK